MARIKDSYVEKLKEHSTDYLPAIIGMATDLKKSGKNLSGLCVFHKEKTPSLTVNPQKGTYKCFGCDAGGDALKFIMDYYQLPFREAVERLAKEAQFTPPEYEESGKATKRSDHSLRVRSALSKASDLYKNQLSDSDKSREFLSARGITAEDISRFNVGFAPDDFDFIPKQLISKVGVKALLSAGLLSSHPNNKRVWDLFRNRIMFPVRDQNGRVIAFGGRTLLDNPTEAKKVGKYINSPETDYFTKGKNLYGLYESFQQRSPEPGTMNVVEGYVDVIACHRHGYCNTVAPMGTAVTSEQMEKLFRYADHLRFVFDGDRSGYTAAYRASMSMLAMSNGKKTASVVILPKGEDPDSYLGKNDGNTLFSQTLANEVPVSRFLISYLINKHGGSSVESKAAVIHHAKEIIDASTDLIYKELLRIELSSALKLDRDYLYPEQPISQSAWETHLGEDETSLLSEASDEILKFCGLALKEPEWLKMFPLDIENVTNPSDIELIKFTKFTLDKSFSTNVSPEKLYEPSLSGLIMYLKTLAGNTLEQKIDIARAYGLGSTLEKSLNQTKKQTETRISM